MNILFVTLSLPHARARHGGGQLSYEWLRHLSRRHSLFLVTILPEEDRPFLPEARALFREIRPVPVYRGALSRLRRRVSHALVNVRFELGEVVDEQLHQLLRCAVVLLLVLPR